MNIAATRTSFATVEAVLANHNGKRARKVYAELAPQLENTPKTQPKRKYEFTFSTRNARYLQRYWPDMFGALPETAAVMEPEPEPEA